MGGARTHRQAQREMVVAYRQEQLALLLEHVREGFRRLDAGEIDVFELDDLVYHYPRSAKELWKSCGYGGNRMDWGVHSLETDRIP